MRASRPTRTTTRARSRPSEANPVAASNRSTTRFVHPRVTRLGTAVFSVAALLAPLCARTAVGQAASPGGFGPFGGDVYSLAAGASGALYAGTARGVFRSPDGGATWVFSSAGIPPTRVQTVIVDPNTPGTLYAGTRTPNGVPSVGIFKSTDAGATWSDANVGLFDPVTGFAPVDVDALAISPADSKVLVAGTAFPRSSGAATAAPRGSR